MKTENNNLLKIYNAFVQYGIIDEITIENQELFFPVLGDFLSEHLSERVCISHQHINLCIR